MRAVQDHGTAEDVEAYWTNTGLVNVHYLFY